MIGSSAQAQTVCESLLAQGIRDTTTTNITEARFADVRSNVCNSNYSNYGKASSSAASGGFDLIGVFGINAGGATASSEYDTKWSQLCSASYNKATSDTNIATYVNTINANILKSFDNCVNVTAERFIRYVQPAPDGKTFNIIFRNKLSGLTGFKIAQLTIRNTSTGKDLDPTKDCDLRSPIPFDTLGFNTWSIVCQKPAEHSVVVSAITSAGAIEPVAVPAVPSPPPGAAEQIAALKGEIESLKGQVSSLQSASGDLKSRLVALQIRPLPQSKEACKLVDSAANDGHLWCPAGSYVAGAKNVNTNNWALDMIWCCPSTQ